MEYILEIDKLRKDFGDFCLNDISFKLPEGYIMGLIGPNGAGKTTTIKLIMNLLIRNSGKINVFGRDLLEHEVYIKSKIGFVYENPSFYLHLNLNQNKKVFAPFYGEWSDDTFNRLVEKFKLPLKKKISKFSQGMKMKSAIAIAMSHNADLLIMDEPTSGLDPVFRREFLEMLHGLIQDEKKSVLFSTHITSDLERIADFITFIKDGEVVFSDKKDDITENYGLVKGGNELLNEDTKSYFKGIRRNEYGFEALTDNVKEVGKKLGSDIVIDKASLEDIMFFTGMEN